jgi:rare lipoprotein A (peptidoglycan hydrolase)
LVGNVTLTVALLPALFGWSTGAGADPVVRTTGSAPAISGAEAAALFEEAIATTTTTTTAPPAPPVTAPPTTVKRYIPPTTVKRAVAPPTTVRRVAAAPSTTAAPRPKPVSAAPVEPAPTGNSQEGKATYYTGGGPGRCAHRSLPFGTVVTVTATSSGKSVRCTVSDRGPFVAGYVIDLDPVEFDQLAPRSSGVVQVRLSW